MEDNERNTDGAPAQFTLKEEIPRANPWVALVLVPAGLIVGVVILIISTVIWNIATGSVLVNAAQAYPFGAMCVFGVWICGKVVRRGPRWWSYVMVAVVAILANVSCQLGNFYFFPIYSMCV